MFAKLTGLVDTVGDDWIILDVQGVGYQVLVSAKTLSRLPEVGQRTSLLTELLIRNELPALIGFADAHEQACFQKLVTVQGVGAKVALAILSALTPDELALAIYNQDKAQISRADGVGPKLAARLLTELKDKVILPEAVSLGVTTAMVAGKGSSVNDVFSALENLGYRRSEAAAAVSKAIEQHGSDADAGTLIRVSLSLLSQKITGAIG